MLGTTERASASASAEFLKGAVSDFLCYYTLFPHCRPDRGAEDCYERVFFCVSVCVFVWSASMSSELHVRFSPNFSMHVTCGRGSVLLWGVVIRYVLPVIWMG